MREIKQKAIDNLRILGIEQVVHSQSGHPGMVMSAAPMLHELYLNYLNVNPKVPDWINRDRFVLSAGHGSALLYAQLHLAGYDISIEDLKNFRSLNSKTPGHPEVHLTPGVDVSTGPLGQGFAMGVGLALAETHLANRYNKKNFNLIDHRTFVLCGDADLEEGVTQESIQLAGLWKLNKLVVLYDSNDIQLDTNVKQVQNVNFKQWFESMNWNYIKVENGFNIDEINHAIKQTENADKPTLIELKTIIGYGHKNQGTPAMHGNPFSNADLDEIKQKFNINENFSIAKDVKELWNNIFSSRIKNTYSKWENLQKQYIKQFPNEWDDLVKSKELNFANFSDLITDKPEATRVSSFRTLQKMQNLTGNMLGGSADLSSATKIAGVKGTYSDHNRSGNNILFGVREFAMAAISNGISLHSNLKSFCSTFVVFSDYMKNAMRLSALQELPVLYLLTHDSLAVGFDGPTHQPIEQLAGFRATPNLYNYRPADMKETIGAYVSAYNCNNAPSTLLFGRQDVSQIPNTCWEKTAKGAYIVKQENATMDLLIIATGSELSLAIDVATALESHGYKIRVVSMPCMELFDEQDETYREDIIPKHMTKIAVIEAASSFGWHKYVGKNGILFTVDKYGKSGNGEDVMNDFGFNHTYIYQNLIKYLKNNK